MGNEHTKAIKQQKQTKKQQKQKTNQEEEEELKNKNMKPIYIPDDHVIDITTITTTTTTSPPPVYYPSIYQNHFASLLLTHKQILNRTKIIAQTIVQSYPNNNNNNPPTTTTTTTQQQEPLVLLCILKGSIPFYQLLANELSLLNHPYIMEFIRAKSYINDKSSGTVTIDNNNVIKSLEGRDVIVIEDIVDTGKTLSVILPKFQAMNPKSLHVCTLLEKRLVSSNVNVNEEDEDEDDDAFDVDVGVGVGVKSKSNNNEHTKFVPKYTGFSIPDKFVVGFGLDYNEMYRDLRDIWILGEKGIANGGYSGST